MPGDGNQGMMHLQISAKTLRPVDEPEIESVFRRADIGEQFSRIAFGVIDEIPRMHFEKSRQQHPSGIGEMGPAAILDLRQIRLADGLAKLLLNRTNNLLLCHFSS